LGQKTKWVTWSYALNILFPEEKKSLFKMTAGCGGAHDNPNTQEAERKISNSRTT
jgi:hypothetical protein